MKRKCENCEWFQPNETVSGKGECRRYVPRELMATSLDGTEYCTDWAVINSDEWCGEFKERNPKNEGLLPDKKA